MDLPKGVIGLMITVMQHKRAGLHDVIVAADLLKADAQFSLWVLEHFKKSGASEAQWLDLLERYEKQMDVCTNAVQKFIRDGDTEAMREVLARITVELKSDANRPIVPEL